MQDRLEPWVTRERGAHGVLVLGAHHEQRVLACVDVAEGASDHDRASRCELVHERRVLVPAILLAPPAGSIVGWSLRVLYDKEAGQDLHASGDRSRMSDGAAPPAEQRLAFGLVAEQYERARPSYPAAAIDEVLTYASLPPGELVVEVGAGTGKATRLLADRGLRVLALEPDPAMAAICRSIADPALVEVVETDFERWRPRDRVGLLVCAQAWHWLDPLQRWQRAAEALRPLGAVAALWTFPVWDRIALRAALDRTYAEVVPEMVADFPAHPGSRAERIAGAWHEDVGEGFVDVRSVDHDWVSPYTAREYTEMIATHQDHIRLDPARKAALLARMRQTIERDGGGIEMVYRTSVCLARHGPSRSSS